MHFHSIGLAVPDRSFAQSEVLQTLETDETFAGLTEKSKNLLRKVLSGKNGIERRHLALKEVREAFVFQPDAMMARFRQHAPALATRAGHQALAKAGLTRTRSTRYSSPLVPDTSAPASPVMWPRAWASPRRPPFSTWWGKGVAPLSQPWIKRPL